MIKTVNIMAPIWLALAIYAGYSGKVDWWTITLMALLQLKLVYTLKKRHWGT